MRISLLVVAFIALASIAIASVGAGIEIPRHVNPVEVSEENPLSQSQFLSAFYEEVLRLTGVSYYSNATSLVRNSKEVYLPSSIRYLIERFNGLLMQEIEHLNLTDSEINITLNLLREGNFKEAYKYLNKAILKLNEANITRNELLDAYKEIRRRLGVNIANLNEIDLLIKNRSLSLKELKGKLRGESAVPTDISLELPKRVWVGSQLTVKGVLTTINGDPIPSEKVIFKLGNITKTFVTDGNGIYRGEIKVPYIYRPNITAVAEYLPEKYLGKFESSRVNRTLEVLYIQSNIYASLNASSAVPGSHVMIRGHASPSGQVVVVRAFGLVKRIRSDEGVFHLPLEIPSVKGGYYDIILRIEPNGTISPSERVLYLMVYRKQLNLSIESPPFIIGGLNFTVKGRISGGNSSVPCRVIIDAFGEERSLVANGSFAFRLKSPLIGLVGPKNITITVEPLLPNYEVASHLVRTYYIDWIGPLAITLLVTISILRLRRERVRIMEPTPIPSVPQKIRIRRSSLRDPFARLYFSAVNMIERSLGMKMRAHYTLREYAEKVGRRLGNASFFFNRLTLLYEAYLYGGMKSGLEKAKGYYSVLKKVLKL